uniref:Uncharacterized protein n=1 Tax=Anguilla anguilla TaxID=7936 RepID=A0A0E9S056_ANGAN
MWGGREAGSLRVCSS